MSSVYTLMLSLQPTPRIGSFTASVWYFLLVAITALVIIVGVLIAVAYYTLLDRKVLGAMQRRRGPNVVGFAGLLQPLADGLKLLLKETIIPTQANTFLFLLAPVLTFATSMIGWAVVPFSEAGGLASLETGLLFMFAVASLGVYGVILAGWSSNSKYAFLGGLRSSAQMISYEVSLGFIILSVVLCSGSTHLYSITAHQDSFRVWHCWFLWPQCVLFRISALAETNRAPFDLPEAEAELVAGYFLDFSSMAFALFFLGEYSAMLSIAVLTIILFWGGWQSPFSGEAAPFWLGAKLGRLAFFWVWTRGSFPRYRYDQRMTRGWKTILPLSLASFVAVASFLVVTEGLPQQLFKAAWS